MPKIDLISDEWTNMIFVGRNKAYGAYVLRQETGKRNVIGIVVVIVLVLLCLLGLNIKKVADAQALKRASMTEVVELSKLTMPKQMARVRQKKIDNKLEELDQSAFENTNSNAEAVEPVASRIVPFAMTESIVAVDHPVEIPPDGFVVGEDGGTGVNTVEAQIDQSKVSTALPQDQYSNLKPTPFRIVEQMPEFPGGATAFIQWLTHQLRYPPAAMSKKIEGTVVVSFIVNTNGSIADLKLEKSINPLLDQEAIRVIRMMPKWKPGLQNNKPCRTMVAVPIVFHL